MSRQPPRRATLLLLLAGTALALPVLGGTQAAATCLPGAPSGVPCLPAQAPVPAPSPSASPGTSPAPAPSASGAPPSSGEPTSTADGTTGRTGVAPAPGLDTGTLPGPASGDSGAVPLPDTAPLDGAFLPGQAPAGPAPETAGDEQAPVPQTRLTPVAATTGSVAQSVSGAFAIVVGVLLVLPLLLAALANAAARTRYAGGPRRPLGPVLRAAAGAGRVPTRPSRTEVSSQRLSSAGLPSDVASAVAAAIAEAVTSSLAAAAPASTTRTTSSRSYDPSGAAAVNPTATHRLYLGLGALAVAALAGFIGWYQLSGNPHVNQQLPYLASAGVIVVIASAIGGALLVGDQLRGDDRRIEELEDAVRELAAVLAPMIEAPARRPARPTGYQDDVLEADVLDDSAPAPRRVRTTRAVARQHD